MTPPSFKEVQFTNGYEFTEGSGYALPEYPFVKPPELVHNKTLRHAVVIVGGGITGKGFTLGIIDAALLGHVLYFVVMIVGGLWFTTRRLRALFLR